MKQNGTIDSYLETLSYSDLLSARQSINNLLIARRSEQLVELRGKLRTIARESGFNLEEVTGKVKRKFGAFKGDVRKAKVRYQHPDRPEYQWSGHGKTPRWLLDAMKAKNRPRDYFRVTT